MTAWLSVHDLPPYRTAYLGRWQKTTGGAPVFQWQRGFKSGDGYFTYDGTDFFNGPPTHFHPDLVPPPLDAQPVPFTAKEMRKAAQWLDARACHILNDDELKNEEGLVTAITGTHAGALFDAAGELRALAAAQEPQDE